MLRQTRSGVSRSKVPGTGPAFALALVLAALSQGHCSLCPARACKRTAPDGSCSLADHKHFECRADRWQKHITSYPNNWYSLSAANNWGVNIPGPLPALEYITDHAPCCRHCVWSLGFPFAVPMVMAISPKQDTCEGTSGFSLCYLDCTKFVSDFSILDSDSSQKINYTEFRPYFADYFVAPANNYKLYSGGALNVKPELSRIDPLFVFSDVDINQVHVSAAAFCAPCRRRGPGTDEGVNARILLCPWKNGRSSAIFGAPPTCRRWARRKRQKMVAQWPKVRSEDFSSTSRFWRFGRLT